MRRQRGRDEEAEERPSRKKRKRKKKKVKRKKKRRGREREVAAALLSKPPTKKNGIPSPLHQKEGRVDSAELRSALPRLETTSDSHQNRS